MPQRRRQVQQFGHGPRRPRKLLLHLREIGRLLGAVQREGATLVPLKLYFNDRGIAKLQLGPAVGKRQHGQRAAEKRRDWERQKDRLMREKCQWAPPSLRLRASP
jgi:SsrA-binding protein